MKKSEPNMHPCKLCGAKPEEGIDGITHPSGGCMKQKLCPLRIASPMSFAQWNTLMARPTLAEGQEADVAALQRQVDVLCERLGVDLGRCPPFERECHTGKRSMPDCNRVKCWKHWSAEKAKEDS